MNGSENVTLTREALIAFGERVASDNLATRQTLEIRAAESQRELEEVKNGYAQLAHEKRLTESRNELMTVLTTSGLPKPACAKLETKYAKVLDSGRCIESIDLANDVEYSRSIF